MCDYFIKMSDVCPSDIASFDELSEGCCRSTHVNPFTFDLHVIGLECKDALGWFWFVIFVTLLIKVGQNYLYTKMNQTQRELLQIEPGKRRLTWLIIYEAIAGVIGIVSILVITGNNAIIWIAVILFNCIGVYYSYATMPPDHHSIALEILNMLEKYKPGEKHYDSESLHVIKVIEKLAEVLDMQRNPPIVKEDVPSMRKRLII